MGLLEQVLGSVLGSRSQGSPAGGASGGMNPLVMAVLGLLASKAMGSRSTGQSAGGLLGGLLGGGGAGPGGLGDLLSEISSGSAQGGQLAGGLGGLIESLRRSGLGDVANSWVSKGPNQPIAPDQLEDALGADTVGQLSQQTGMPQQDLLSQLSQVLPEIVDRLTPNGRLPKDDELGSY